MKKKKKNTMSRISIEEHNPRNKVEVYSKWP